MFTFLPVEEWAGRKKDAELNESKARLAWEVTALIHGKEEADKALAAAHAAFGGAGDGDLSHVPSTTIPRAKFEAGIGVLDLFALSGLATSKSEARRLVQQGGAVVNDRKIDDEKAVIDASWLDEGGSLMLRAGKKRVFRIVAM